LEVIVLLAMTGWHLEIKGLGRLDREQTSRKTSGVVVSFGPTIVTSTLSAGSAPS
jgi:hypothetical protein